MNNQLLTLKWSRRPLWLLSFLLLSLAAFMPSRAFAEHGIYSSYVQVGGTYYYLLNNGSSFSAFQGASLGTYSKGQTLIFNGGEINAYRYNGSTTTGANLYYAIYPTGSRPATPTFTTFSLPDAGGSGNNEYYKTYGGSGNLLSGLTAGNYTLEIYGQDYGNFGSDYLNNGSSATNYTATFTVSNVLCGTYTINSGAAASLTNYVSFTTAFADLNTYGVSCAAVFNVIAGTTYSERAALGSTVLNASLSSTNTLTFQKSGTGANPIINATVGSNGIQDAIISLSGVDYTTFNGINLTDGTTATSPATAVEYGYALFRQSNTDGCQNNTFQNCTITMNRSGSSANFSIGSAGSTPNVPVGIYSGYTTTAGTAIALSGASTAGRNSGNKFYSNTLLNTQTGIALLGFADNTSPYVLFETGNDVGGSTSGTGNLVQNYGGQAYGAYGVLAYHQNGINVSYNTFDNGGGTGGAASPNTLYGIDYRSATVTATTASTLNNNTITLTQAANGSQVAGISVAEPGSATVSVSTNTISHTLSSTTASSSNRFLIVSSVSTGALTISSNQLTYSLAMAGGSTVNLSGAAYGISVQSSTVVSGALTLDSNVFTGTLTNSGSGSVTADMRGILLSGTSGNTTTNTIVTNNSATLNLNSNTAAGVFGVTGTALTPLGISAVGTMSGNLVLTGNSVAINTTASTGTMYLAYTGINVSGTIAGTATIGSSATTQKVTVTTNISGSATLPAGTGSTTASISNAMTISSTITGAASIVNNTIATTINNSSSGVAASFATQGLMVQATLNSTSSLNQNTVGFTLSNTGSGSISTALAAIGHVSSSNTLAGAATVSSNTLTFAASKSSGTVSSVYLGAFSFAPTSSTLTLDSNTLNGMSSVSTGQLTFVNVTGTSSGLLTISNNSLSGTSTTQATTAAAGGYFINASSATNNVTVTGNKHQYVTWNNGGSSIILYGYYNFGSPTGGTAAITNNTFSNLSLTGTMAFYGIYSNTASSQTVNISSNTLNTSIATVNGNAYGVQLYLGLNATVNSNLIGLSSTTGNLYGLDLETATTGLTANSNTISLTTSGTSSSYGINGVTGVPQTFTSNNITGVSTAGTSYGIYLGGSSTHAVSLNTIGGVATSSTTSTDQATGIYLNNASTANIFQNVVNGVSVTGATGSATAYGFNMNTTPTTTNLYRNKFVSISNAQAGTAGSTGVYGINLNGASSTTATAYNNIVGALTAPASVGNNAIIGLNSQGSTTTSHNVYFNTIALSGTSSGSGFGTSGILFGVSASPTLTLRDNIVVNKTTPTGSAVAVALRRVSGTNGTAPSNLAASSNYNLYYTGTPGSAALIYAEGTGTTFTNALQTLAQYKKLVAASEANSYTEDVPFQTATAGQTNYLHISSSTPTIVESNGVAVTTPSITNDYDGDARGPYPLSGQVNGGGTAPDLGADEGDFAPITIDPAVTAFVSPVQTTGCMSNSAQTVTVTVKNNGATATTSAVSVSGTVSFNGGTATSLGTAVTIPSGLAAGASTNVTLTTTYNMSAVGTYVFTANITGGGDQYAGNNTLISPTYTVAAPTVGTLSTSSATTFCGSTPASVALSLTTATNGQVQFQASTDGGTTYTTLATVAAATPTTYTATGVTQTTMYRAIVVCNTTATSNTVTVTNQQPVITITTNPTSGTICSGSTATLTASASPASQSVANNVVFNATFNSGTDGFTVVNAGSQASSAFTRQTPTYSLGSGPIAYKGPSSIDGTAGSAFYVADSDKSGLGATSPSTATALVSPVFSLVNYTSATLFFDQYLRYYTSGDVSTIDISTDGGSTYSALASQTASAGSNATPGANYSVSLASYVGQSNLRIRFRYITDDGYYWAVDNVKVTGTYTDNVTYSWTPTASIVSGANTATATTTALTATTTYTVTATYPTLGCSSSKQVTITVNPLPTASLTNNGPICGSGTGTVTVTLGGSGGPYNYSYSVNGGTAVNVTNATSPSTISLGTVSASQTVKITALSDKNTGCAATTATLGGAAYTTTLTVNPAATVNAGSSPANVCAGSTYATTGTYGGGATSATYTSSGTGTFSNGGVINGSTSSVTYTPSAADISNGSVTLTLTSNGQTAPCGAVTSTLPLTINPAPTVSAGSPATICAGSTYATTGTYGGGATSATYTTSGTGTFSNGGTINGSTSSVTYTPSMADISNGSVTLTLTSNGQAASCSVATSTTTLTINALPTFTTSKADATCNGSSTGSITVTASGGTGSYQFSRDGGSTFVSGSSPYTFAGLAAGSYPVTVRNATGAMCAAPAAQSVTIGQPSAVTLTTTATGDCTNSNAGTIVATAMGGTGATYTYSKDGTNFQATGTFTGLAAGSYTITARDGNGCTGTATATVGGQSKATFASTNPGTVCVGTSATLTGTLSGAAPFTGTYTVNGGTAQTLTITGSSFSLSTGNLTAGSNTISISLTDGSGCVNNSAGSATVATTSVTTWNGSVSSDWYNAGNWDYCVPSALVSAVVPASVASGNAPVINSGTAQANNVTLQGALTLTLSGSNTALTLQGDLVTNTAGTFTAGTGTTVTFGASGIQTIGMGAFYNLTLGGNANKNLGGAVAVNGTLDLTNGQLSQLNYDMTLNATSSAITGASTAHHITLNGNGGRLCWLNVDGTNKAFYPVGIAANAYSPVTLTNAGTTDSYCLTIKSGVDNPVSSGVHYVNRQWNIEEGTPGGSSVTMQVQWMETSENPSFDRTNCGIAHYLAGQGWELPGAALGAAVAGSESGSWMRTRTGITSFSPFAVEDSSYPLPVELTAFTAQRQGSDARLDWTTATERDSRGFEVQVSTDGTSFRTLGFVAGAGSSVTAHSYRYLDQEAGKAGLRYYRLRQVDFDGSEHFTGVRSVDFGAAAGASLTAAPNPFGQQLRLYVTATQATTGAELTLTDMLGREVLRQLVSVPAGSSQLDLSEAVQYLPTGVYLVRLPLDGQPRTVKVTRE